MVMAQLVKELADSLGSCAACSEMDQDRKLVVDIGRPCSMEKPQTVATNSGVERRLYSTYSILKLKLFVETLPSIGVNEMFFVDTVCLTFFNLNMRRQRYLSQRLDTSIQYF